MWPCDTTADQIAVMSLLPLAQWIKVLDNNVFFFQIRIFDHELKKEKEKVELSKKKGANVRIHGLNSWALRPEDKLTHK